MNDKHLTPRTDAADDITMRFTARHERVCDLARQLERELAALRLLKGMDALECSALGTFLKGGDIPNTIDAARGALVRRVLEAEAASQFTFAPTHRHVQGGLYQVLDDNVELLLHTGPDQWEQAIRYCNENGKQFVRSCGDFGQRFTRLEADEALIGSTPKKHKPFARWLEEKIEFHKDEFTVEDRRDANAALSAVKFPKLADEVWAELVVLVGCTSPDGSAELDQVRFMQEQLRICVEGEVTDCAAWNRKTRELLKRKTPSVPNPCSICKKPIFGSYIGTGDGTMSNGGSFAHIECYRQGKDKKGAR